MLTVITDTLLLLEELNIGAGEKSELDIEFEKELNKLKINCKKNYVKNIKTGKSVSIYGKIGKKIVEDLYENTRERLLSDIVFS